MDLIKAFFETHPQLIYSSISGGMFLSALFPVSFIFYGDYIFIPAAILSQSGFIDIRFVYFATILGVYVGDLVSFFLGHSLERTIFTPDAKYLNTHLLQKGERFFEKYGKFAILFSKGLPVAPGITPFLAGINRMNRGMFLAYDLIATIVIFAIIYGTLYGGIGAVRIFFGW
ncbi:MAG: VTT domain-containing protein [Candidatus Gracilibacteria bacterium]|nr:VTT domain-containing protein [Candidatus Gracilibacteria bacterium]